MDEKFKNLKPDIQAHKINTPIQLLAALLIGLFSINSSFFVAAGLINEPSWLPSLLCIAAVINVPLFLVSIFLLQTVFRAELQEDKYYSQYLQEKIKSKIEKSKDGSLDKDTLRENIELVISNLTNNKIPATVEKLVKHLKPSYDSTQIEKEIKEMIAEGYIESDSEIISDGSILTMV